MTKLTALPGVLKASPPTVRMSDHPQVIGEDGAMPETVTIGREAGLKSVWYWVLALLGECHFLEITA